MDAREMFSVITSFILILTARSVNCDSSINCSKITCSITLCKRGERLHVEPGQCCPTCMPSTEGCAHKGKTYQNGQVFKDICNTCDCRNGQVICTNKECADKPGSCPQDVDIFSGKCQRCQSDYTCPGSQKCCRYRCRQLCRNPLFEGGCWQDDQHYVQGADVPNDDPCLRCKCVGDEVECTNVVCPPLNCPANLLRPHGFCCSICQPFFFPQG